MRSVVDDPARQGDLLEEWRPVVATDEEAYGILSSRYEVSNLGRVRNARTGHVLQAWEGPKTLDPYLRVCLYADGARVVCWVHHLVAAAFLGPRPEGLVIDHVDADKHQNAAGNLRYISQGENVRRAIAGNGNGEREELEVDEGAIAEECRDGHELVRTSAGRRVCHRCRFEVRAEEVF